MKNPFRSNEPINVRDALQIGGVLGITALIFFLPPQWAGLAFFHLLLLVYFLIDKET